VQLELSSTGGWADYVFAPDYKLMPLKQVAEYLKTYRHLPGMASEAEMKAEGGINVGKIAAQQQAKIEELFLYVIEVNKKVEHLQTELEQLRKENQSLRKQVKK
jgi:outer membrane murein-binding lipoprotein Lpp